MTDINENKIIIDKIFNLFNPIINFIKTTNGKLLLIIYVLLIIISLYFLNKYKKEQTIENNINYIQNNTSRNKAIEAFNNYNKELAKKLSQQCNNILNNNNDNTNDDNDDILPINKNGLFYFNNLEELIKSYIKNNILGDINDNKIIIDNYFLSLDVILDTFVKSYFNKIIKIIKKITPELKYSIISNINDIFNNIDIYINENIINDMEEQLRELISFNETKSQLITETPIPTFIKKELYERFYYEIYTYQKKNKIFKNLCLARKNMTKLKNELNSAYRQSYDTNIQKDKIVKTLTSKIEDEKNIFNKLYTKYEIYLMILKHFSTDINNKKLLKKEIDKITTSNIQPSNETILDNINSTKKKIKSKLSSTPQMLNNNDITYDKNDIKVENILSQQYSKNATQYENELLNRNGDMKLDPVKIFSDVEQGAINFLQNINNTTSNKINENFISKFEMDKANRGFYLQNDDLDINNKHKSQYINNNDYNSYNSFYNINKNIINNNLDNENINNNLDNENINNNLDNENINNNLNNENINNNLNNENINNNIETFKNPDNKKKDNNLLNIVGAQFLNISEIISNNTIITNIINNIFNILKLNDIKSSEQLGFLLIIISIILYFIDLSS
jgi:hypothetical protein